MNLENNVISVNDNETIIGKIEDIEKEFIKLLESNITDIENMEEFVDRLTEIQRLLENLEEEKEENGNIVIKVGYNPMGAYQYEEINISL